MNILKNKLLLESLVRKSSRTWSKLRMIKGGRPWPTFLVVVLQRHSYPCPLLIPIVKTIFRSQRDHNKADPGPLLLVGVSKPFKFWWEGWRQSYQTDKNIFPAKRSSQGRFESRMRRSFTAFFVISHSYPSISFTLKTYSISLWVVSKMHFSCPLLDYFLAVQQQALRRKGSSCSLVKMTVYLCKIHFRTHIIIIHG